MRPQAIRQYVGSCVAVLRRSIGGQSLFDGVAWIVALVAAVIFRYDFVLSRIEFPPIWALCVLAAILQFGFGRWAFNLYRGRFRIGSFNEVQALAATVAVTAATIGIPTLFAGATIGVPRSTVIVALPIALVLMGASRYVRRLLWQRGSLPRDGAERALIYGAGSLANFLVPQMLTDPDSRYLPVGLIDDSPSKSNFSIGGIPVLGNRQSLRSATTATGATTLIVCIGRADSQLIRTITDAATADGLRVLVFPLLSEILDGRSSIADLKEVSIEDLIGRHPVDTEVDAIAEYLSGKRILITGAGGSIGSVLAEQLARFNPGELMLLDRDETGLQGTQLSIAGHGLLDTKDVILADIRDARALSDIFRARRPEVVFHAAALKHLPMLEQYPGEAWQTNVLGTLNVLEAAREVGVTTFVNISTDKAANPTSVLGHSKRAAERLTAWFAEDTGQRYLSVRFGNVIGSRGSMLPTFRRLIATGGPLTITHPDVTRYFMTIPEACQLVIQAGAIGRAQEVLILDMGEAVRILDVAERMIAMSGANIEIVYTGLRPGEKLHEELLGLDELDERPFHPKISHALVSSLSPIDLDRDEWLRRCGVAANASGATA